MTRYHFKVPSKVIWISHILMGLFFVYISYLTLNKKIPSQINSLVLMNLGVLGSLYHAHIWFSKNHNHEHLSNQKIIGTLYGKKYDLTKFLSSHPGGSVIRKVHNKDIKKVWKDNGVGWHLNNSNVKKVLKKYLVN